MERKNLYILLSTIFVLCSLPLWFYVGTRNEAKTVSEKDLPEIIGDSLLRVVTEYNSIGFFVEKGEEKGFQYEIIQAYAAYLQIPVEIIVETDLEKSIRMLKKGTCDIIARNIPITTELREEISFTEPITQNRQILVQRTALANNGEPPVRNQLHLGGKTLYVPKRSPYIQRIRNLSDEIADTIQIKEMPLYEAEHLMAMVAHGDIDFAVSDESIVLANIDNYPQLDVRTAISFTQLTAWGVRQQAPLLQLSIDEWLATFKKTKEYRNLYRKYYQ